MDCLPLRNLRLIGRGITAMLLVLVSAAAAHAEVRQVLLLQSFDRGTLVLDRFEAGFRAQLDRRSSDPITFMQFVVSPAGFDEVPELAFLEFLRAAFVGRQRPDLIVTTGGPAAAFARKYRAQLFPDVPLLFAAVDYRFVGNSDLRDTETAVAVANDPVARVEDVLSLLPETENVFVVMGVGTLGRFWRQQFEQDARRLGGRIRFFWPDGLSYAEVLQRVSTLPPRSAIFFSSYDVDAFGATFSTQRALTDIRTSANAPTFGGQGAEFGYGIVGGRLISTDDLARTSADVALQVLQGASPSRIRVPVQQPGVPIFDWRELKRWGISESRLPLGSEILFRELTVWERYRWAIIAAFSALVGQAALISALLVNRARRRRAEQSLRESEGRFRVLANAAPVLIRMSGSDGLASDFNISWLEFTRRPLESEIGRGWLDAVHPDDVVACRETYQRAFDRREPYRMEYRLRRFDGAFRWMLDTGKPRFTPNGSFAGYIGSAVDITDLKAARATLTSLNHRLLQAQEQERGRLARELHDDICQRMTLLAVDLQQLHERVPAGDADLRAPLQTLYEDVTALGRDVNGISHRLHSSKLDILGLATAVATFCREIAARHNVSVEFSHADVPAQLPDGVPIALFRVLQESLSNAVKHSGALAFRVTLGRLGDDLQLEVADAGRGFDAAAAMATSGLGLVSMQERLRLVNGELVIESNPASGTTVRASVPLPPASAVLPGATAAGATPASATPIS